MKIHQENLDDVLQELREARFCFRNAADPNEEARAAKRLELAEERHDDFCERVRGEVVKRSPWGM